MENEQITGSASDNAAVFPGVIDTLKSAWEIYKQRFPVIVKLVLIPIVAFIIAAVIMGVSLLAPIGLSMSNSASSIFSGSVMIGIVIVAIIFIIAAIILSLWSQIALLIAIKDRQENIGAKESLRRSWPKVKSYFWIMLLSGAVIVGGFLLAIVPGVIFAVWFSLAIYVFISEDIGGMNALLKSKEYVRGRWWSVFWRFFGLWLLIIAASIILGFIPLVNFLSNLISIFVFTPLSIIYGFLVYNNLKSLKGEFEFASQKKGLFTGIAILGAVIIPIMILGTILLVALDSAREKAREMKKEFDETNLP